MTEAQSAVFRSERPTQPSRLWAVCHGAGWASLAWLAFGALGGDEIAGVGDLDWLWLAVAIGGAAGAAGLAGAFKAAGLLQTAGIVVIGSVPGFGRMATALIRTDSLPTAPVDGVLVLSASVTADGLLNPEAVDRLLGGLGLTKGGMSRQLIVSRVFTKSGTELISSDRDQRSLIDLVDPTVGVSVLDAVGSTRDEAVRLKALADQRGWRRVIVVTAPTHSRRACASVEKVGLAVVCRPSPDRTTAVRSQTSPIDRLAAFGQWGYETLGWWKYRWNGWA